MQNQIWAPDDLGCELQHFVTELDSIVHVVHQATDLGLHDHIEEMVLEHGAHTLERRTGELGADAVSRRPASHQLLDGRQQLLVHVFLCEIDVGAGVATPEACLGLLSGREQNEGDVGHAGVAAKDAAELDTGDRAHLDVAHDQVERPFEGELQCFLTGARFGDLEAHRFELLYDMPPNRRTVVHHQDPKGPGCFSPLPKLRRHSYPAS